MDTTENKDTKHEDKSTEVSEASNDSASIESRLDSISGKLDTLLKKQPSKGGFLNGGLLSSLLFLLAFFLLSFSLGSAASRNSSVVGTTGGNVAQGSKTFNVDGFKKIAADLKLDTKKFNTCLDTGKYADPVKNNLSEGVSLGVTGTPMFLVNGVAVVGAHPIETFDKAIAGQLEVSPEASSAGLQDGERATQQVSSEGSYVKGNKDAPVTIYEYSDFQCPFCARFYQDTYKTLDEKYIKSGKVKLVYKDFPLSIHPQAQKAAEAGRCAGEQNKFWEMHDKLFELQLQS